MDIKAYIESGIIESYVLGLASSNEIAEVEQMRSQYKEVQEAIDIFSISLEARALAEAVAPPDFIKENILQTLRKEQNRTPLMPFTNAGSPVIKSPQVRISPWKILAAASIILFVISAALNFYFYNKYSQKNQAYQALLEERDTLFAGNKIYQSGYHEWEHANAMLADPAMLVIKMKTAPGKHNKDATVLWDSRTKDVYVMAKEMPLPQNGRQFQLWAMVNGKPVDAGLISKDCIGICKMKNIPKAQAFAVTLEKEGGSESPDLSQLFVIGNI